MLLTVDNISYSVGKLEILKNVSIQLQKGQILGLLGPSGSGKTTLLKHITGVLPSFEKIKINDRPVPFEELFEKTSYMLQSDALYEDLTGLDNMKFFANLYNIEDRKKSIDDQLDLCQLTEHRNKMVKAYSGGMKRRLSLAVALVNDPDFMVLDEPTVGIDPILRKVFWKYFHGLKNSGKSIIVTTHIMSDADECDTVYVLSEGEIVANGSPSELKRKFDCGTMEEVYLKTARSTGD